MIQRNDFIVLDTETTGLFNAEIVQIALIDAQGNVLLDTLIKPVNRIPYDAIRIHGITNERVANAPTWAEVTDQVQAALRGRDVVVYNAVFDRKMLHSSAEAAKLPKVDWKTFSRWWCAMETFAEIQGGYRYGRPKMHKLANAARYYNIPVVETHTALGDARLTLALVRAIAGRMG
jgi:DNA polymerase III epsilon subunit-like protein